MKNKQVLTARQSIATGASSVGKTKDLEYCMKEAELEYQTWWTRSRLKACYQALPDDTLWNFYICLIALMAIVWVAVNFNSSYVNLFDLIYNVSYAVHVISIAYNLFGNDHPDITCWIILGFLVDFVTYSHYVSSSEHFQLICYYLRLHRPLRYLWALNDYNMKGSVLGTTLKYCYITLMLRVTWALAWLHIDELERDYMRMAHNRRALYDVKRGNFTGDRRLSSTASQFLSALYIVNKMFIPIGPSVPPANDIERVACLLVMITGCLVVTGAAVASLALVISQYMRPEEDFRARYQLIIKEMKESHIPQTQRDKVEAFYNMYWHKQKAVSYTHLLPTFPPTLPATIYTDIYFEATQKTRILRDLSYQFLCELAKKMETINYIPGDAIIKRSSKKSSIIYITYGDIEMLTAEDDSTAILRMSCGTVLTPCAGCPATGCGSSHLQIRAATFCTAHVLRASDLWRVVLKYGRNNDQKTIIMDAFNEHMERVKRHYYDKAPVIAKHKSSIYHFKRSLLALREAVDANGNLVLARTDMFLEVAGCYLIRNHDKMTALYLMVSTVQSKINGDQRVTHYPSPVAAVMPACEKLDMHRLNPKRDPQERITMTGFFAIYMRADASLTDEVDGICLRSTFPCILQPNSSLQDAWHSFVACLIVVVCFTHPYYMVFRKKVPIEFRFFDYVITTIYVLDLIVHLSTGANVEEGIPITFLQTSSQQMRSKWFVLDVIGTVPILEFVGSGHFAGMNKLVRLPKVFRVLKSMEETCVYRSNVLRFLTYTLLLLIACYLIAALQQGFMCFQSGYCQVTNFTHSPFWEFRPLDDEGVESRLAFGLYWAISMITFTTHKSTWGPENWNNVLYTMFVLEICIVLRIFMEAVYSATIMVTTVLQEDYDACIGDVKNLFVRNQIDSILRQRFITYLQLCWYTDKAYSMTNKKSSIFYDLPPHVNQDILGRQRSNYMLCIPFMKFLQKEDLMQISSKARLFYTSPNEIILNTGDITNEMYVIKKGFCEILCPETKQVVGIIGAKNHFAVFVCLIRLPAYYTVRAASHVQLFSISRKHLLRALENPKLKDGIQFIKMQPILLFVQNNGVHIGNYRDLLINIVNFILEYKRLMEHRDPLISYMPPNPPPNTERFQLPRKHEPDTAFLHPFNTLGFLSVLRYIFPRFTIRPDGEYLTKYEWFRAGCAMISTMVFPSYAYLVLQWPSLYLIATLLDLSAYYDIFQRMLVGYFNKQGILVYHPFSTAVHYLKGAFIIDLLGCLPLENLDAPRKEAFGDVEMYQVTKTNQFLMLNRLLQLYRLPGALLVISRYIERRDIILVIKGTPLFLALLNVFTCLMVFYSVNIYYSPDNNNWSIVPHNDNGGSWIHLFEKTLRFNLTESPWNLHLTCYFWIVYETTTTGYNSFNPSNYNVMEILFTGMVIAAMMTTYYSVRIISIRANVNKALAAFQEHLKDIFVFMRRENLDKSLQKEVFSYYEYNWDKMGGIDYRSVLKLCDQITLRTDAILHLFGPTFSMCPILSNCDVSLLRIIGRAVTTIHFLSDMKIVDANDVIQDMYFLDDGDVDVRHTTEDLCTVVRLPRGSIFGNIEGAETTRCPVTFIARSRIHLLVINSKTFHEIISDFPAVKNLIKEHLDNDDKNYIMGNNEDGLKSHKIRSLNTRMSMKSRSGIIKYLHLKDKIMQIYLIVVCLVCVYIDLYNAGFQDNRTAIICILYVLDVAFYVKILMQCILPYLVNEFDVRRVLIPLRTEYFKGEFKYDALSCIPIEIFSVFSSQYRWFYFAVLRLNRMFRIVTIYKCLKKRHERVTIDLTLNTIFSVLVWFTIFVHTTTCLWYFIGIIEESVAHGSSWRYTDDGGSWCHNQYICSLYFVLTTFTQNGVGDIMPKKQSEVVFVSILQIISTMVYMIYVGEFSNVIQYQSFRSFNFYCDYLELQEFLKNNRVSKNLVKLVNRYSLHLWRESRGMQQPHFLKIAPDCLRLKIMSAAYLHHLTRHHVFEKCEPAFLRQLVGCLRLYTYNENMYVVKEGEITDSMYLIHTGRIQESTEGGESPQRIYPARSYFGVLQGLTNDTPYTHSYCTMVKSQVLTLQLNDWAYLLKHFPLSRDIIYKNTKGDDFGSAPSKDSYEPFTKKLPVDKNQKPSLTKKEDKGSPQTPPLNLDFEDKSSTFILTPGPTLESSLLKVSKAISPMDSKNTLESIAENDANKDINTTASQSDTPSHITQLIGDTIESKYLEDNIPDSSSTLLKNITSAVKPLTEKDKEASVHYISSNQSINNNVLLFNEVNTATEGVDEKSSKTEDKLNEDTENVSVKVSEYINKEEGSEEHNLSSDMTTHSKSNVNNLPKADEGVIASSGPAEIKQVKERTEKTLHDDSAAVLDDDITSLQSAKSNRRYVHYENDKNEESSVETTKLDSQNLPDSQVIQELSTSKLKPNLSGSDTNAMNRPELVQKEKENKDIKASSSSDSDSSIK